VEFGGSQCRWSYRDKPFTLYVHNRRGVGRDYLRMTIDNVPQTAGSDLQINIKPGIGGVELIAAASRSTQS
jgi:hypothetical protein